MLNDDARSIKDKSVCKRVNRVTQLPYGASELSTRSAPLAHSKARAGSILSSTQSNTWTFFSQVLVVSMNRILEHLKCVAVDVSKAENIGDDGIVVEFVAVGEKN